MRLLNSSQTLKRGCADCTHVLSVYCGNIRYACSFSECPYHELDRCETYKDYLRPSGRKKRKKIFKM